MALLTLPVLITFIELIIGLNSAKVLSEAVNMLKEKGFVIDYIELVNESDLEPVSEIIVGKSYILACAVYLGSTRLIDNILFKA